MSELAHARTRRAPSGAGIIAGSLAVLYAGLTPLHLLLLTGIARQAMALVAAVSSLAMIAVALRWRRSAAPNAVVDMIAVVPLVNSLAHIGLTGEVSQTTTLVLTVVAIGAGVTSRRSAALLIVVGCLSWLALLPVVALDQRDQTGHYGIQLAMAVLLAGVLHEVRHRREHALRRTRDDLAAQAAATEASSRRIEASERRFRSIFTGSPVGMSLSDDRGRFVAVNPALCEWLDRTESELLGSSSATFTHPDNLELNRGAQQMITGAPEGTAQIEKRYLLPDGTIRWAWLTLTHVDGPIGESWTLAHAQDVTERKAAETQLADSEANLAAVSDVVRGIRSGDDPRVSVLDAALQIADASSAYLVESDGEDGLIISASAGLDLTGTRVPTGLPSAAAHVWRTGKPLFIDDARDHPLVSKALLALTGARSVLIQPVVSSEGVVAVLAATWKEALGDISDRAARAVALLADETAVALEHDGLLARYTELATVDQLTGLPNRRGWDEQILSLMSDAARHGHSLVVALADLDHFKAYNDLFGHVQGDVLLRSMTGVLNSNLRSVDVAARWGGEEFVIAMADTDEPTAQQILGRVAAGIPEAQTVSVGFAAWDGHESAEELVARADVALYEAKEGGRNRIVAASVATTASTRRAQPTERRGQQLVKRD